MVQLDPSIHPSQFSEENKMQKPSIQGALYTLILMAIVAVFSSVGTVGAGKSGKATVGAPSKGEAGMLTADGTSPYPRPPATFTAVS